MVYWRMMGWKRLGRFLGWVLGVEVVGGLGAVVTGPAIKGWYVTLAKPGFTPPNWVFGPVWTGLFLLMGVAGWLVYEEGWKKKQVRRALAVFGGQLGANVAWSFIFFGLKQPFWALGEIALLWGLILWTIVEFNKVSRLAAYLLVPYLVWVSFALVLNGAIAVLN